MAPTPKAPSDKPSGKPRARLRVADLDDPRVTAYRNQKDAWLRASAAMERGEPDPGLQTGLFMAEGILVVEALIRSPFAVHSILGTPNRLDALESRTPLPEAPVYEADRAVMDGIAGFPIHRGMLACGHRGPERPVDALLGASPLVILEDLANHDNVGGIFRTVAALGGGRAGVVLSPRCCDPLYRKALRVSIGHALTVPHARSRDWPADLRRIAAGYELLALTPAAPEELTARPDGLDRPARSVALLVGAEGPGLSETAVSVSRPVRIPITPGVDSLNAGVAVAIALDRLRRS